MFKIILKRIHHPSMFCLLVGHFFIANANEFEVRGNIEVQGRFFTEEALFPSQHDQQMKLKEDTLHELENKIKHLREELHEEREKYTSKVGHSCHSTSL